MAASAGSVKKDPRDTKTKEPLPLAEAASLPMDFAKSGLELEGLMVAACFTRRTAGNPGPRPRLRSGRALPAASSRSPFLILSMASQPVEITRWRPILPAPWRPPKTVEKPGPQAPLHRVSDPL